MSDTTQKQPPLVKTFVVSLFQRSIETVYQFLDQDTNRLGAEEIIRTTDMVHETSNPYIKRVVVYRPAAE